MKKYNKKEKLQSRREFFKNATKSVLPVIAAISVANMPLIGNAMNHESVKEMGCNYGCYSSCYGTCKTSCYQGCSGSCKYSCQTTCQGDCRTGCSGSCSGNCYTTCSGSARGIY